MIPGYCPNCRRRMRYVSSSGKDAPAPERLPDEGRPHRCAGCKLELSADGDRLRVAMPAETMAALFDGYVAAPDIDLVGLTEIAERWGASPNTVRQMWWRAQHGMGNHPFPEPIGKVGNVYVWNWATVLAWRAGLVKTQRRAADS